MYDDFVRALTLAVLSGDLRGGEAAIRSSFGGLEISLEVGTDPNQPFVVAGWHVASRHASQLMLSMNLLAHDRADFAVNRLGYTIPMLAAYHQSGTPLVGHVNISLEDHAVCPGLSYCDFAPDAYLLPDPVFVSTGAYEAIGHHYATEPVAWADRVPVAFWRGSTTGRLHEVPSWRQLPRVRLCEIVATRDDLFDVGISQIVGLEQYADDIRASGFMRGYIPAEQFQRFRYQIDLDGNSNSWPGLFQKLLTGSPTLKVASPFGFRQWFYDRLIPWVNHIPVAADMADLIETVRWLKTHDDAARMIGEAGRQLALSMTYERETQAASGTICSALRASGWADFRAQQMVC